MNALQKRDMPRSVILVDRGGAFVRRISRDEACVQVGRGGAVFLYRADGRICGVRLIEPDRRDYGGGQSRPSRYSHNRETEYNPHGCWTLRHLPCGDRDLYTRVLEECLTERAAA